MSEAAKLYVASLGCPKNLSDTEHVLAALEEALGKVAFTGYAEESDIILVNTCAFIEKAVSESIETILEISQSKKEGQKLIVFGCLPLRYGAKMQELMPEVDNFVFHVEPCEVAQSILQAIGMEKDVGCKAHRRIVTGNPWQVYVKISEGCSKRCTYCLIPGIRGRLRCISPETIITEIDESVERGAVEVTLVAQDLTSYHWEGLDLTGLLEMILKKTRVPWLRLMYLYPTGISEELLRLIGTESRICKYLDIPVQHASSRILRRMGRSYSGTELERTMETIRKHLPDASLRTTVMVGFPGEEESDFHTLMDFIERWRFHHLGCFTYCDEKEASSSRLDSKVDEEVMERRREQILSVQKEISVALNREFIGRRLQVLVDGYCEESDLLLCSRTMFQAPEVDGKTYLNKGNSRPGALETVEVTDAYEYDLVAEIVGD